MSNMKKLLKSANTLFLKKHYRDAIPIYDNILEIDPNNLNALNNKGYALSKSKDYHNALICYDEGLKINPHDKILLINKISTQRKMKMLPDALKNCDMIQSISSEMLQFIFQY